MTPDLQTEIRSTRLTVARANQIARESESLDDGLQVWSAWEVGFFRRKPFLEIPALHDFLADAADWNDESWDFEPEGRARLVRTMSWLYERLPETFSFSTTWGPVTIDELGVDRAELLEIIHSNTVSTGTVYQIRPRAEQG